MSSPQITDKQRLSHWLSDEFHSKNTWNGDYQTTNRHLPSDPILPSFFHRRFEHFWEKSKTNPPTPRAEILKWMKKDEGWVWDQMRKWGFWGANEKDVCCLVDDIINGECSNRFGVLEVAVGIHNQQIISTLQFVASLVVDPIGFRLWALVMMPFQTWPFFLLLEGKGRFCNFLIPVVNLAMLVFG